MNIVKEFDKNDNKFKTETVIYARENKEKSINELLKVMKVFTDNLDEKEYPISVLYAVYLLSEFKETKLYPMLIKILNYDLPDDEDFFDYFGECLADRFPCFVVSTYNGDYKSLMDIVNNEILDLYQRSFAIESLAYLTKIKKIDRDIFLDFIIEVMDNYDENEQYDGFNVFADGIINAAVIANAIELIKPLRNFYDNKLKNINMFGEFDNYLNYLFDYNDKSDVFEIEDTVKMMSWWAMFDEDEELTNDDELFENMYNALKEEVETIPNENIYKKVGRNEPCPCGSGKKYKKCCLNKVNEGLPYQKYIDDLIEKFPKKKNENEKDLYDFYDKFYVDMDFLMYKGLLHKQIPLTIKRNMEKELKIDIKNLNQAFDMFKEVIKNIKTIEEYDDKVAIHYTFKEFIYGYLDKLDDYFKYDSTVTNKKNEIINILERFKYDSDIKDTIMFHKTLYYKRENKIEEGIEYLKSLLKEKNDSYDIYKCLFSVCSELNNYSEVRKKISSYIKKAPEDMQDELEYLAEDFLN